MDSEMDSLSWDSVIRGHHIYKNIWTPFVGEILRVEQEVCNPENHFAVPIVKVETIIGHVPREVSCLFWHFIQHDGIVSCEITGHRKPSIGLEVPCTYNLAPRKTYYKIAHKFREVWCIDLFTEIT